MLHFPYINIFVFIIVTCYLFVLNMLTMFFWEATADPDWWVVGCSVIAMITCLLLSLAYVFHACVSYFLCLTYCITGTNTNLFCMRISEQWEETHDPTFWSSLLTLLSLYTPGGFLKIEINKLETWFGAIIRPDLRTLLLPRYSPCNNL